MAKKPLAVYLEAIDKDEAQGIIIGLINAGFSRDEIKDALPHLLDELLPLGVLVPGPAGAILEAADGPILRLVVDAIFPLLWKRAARRAGPSVHTVVKVS